MSTIKDNIDIKLKYIFDIQKYDVSTPKIYLFL